MPERENPVFILFGPTASGKTALLEQLFTGAEAFCPAEVISADCAQVYRGLDIGTAKPPPALRAALPHHLIDICGMEEQFNAGDFVRRAVQAAQAIQDAGKLAVISGGTGFYLNNFIYGLPAAPPSSAEARDALKAELRERGADALYAELAQCDRESAARIHANDHYRLLRALEVFRVSGKPLSSFQSFSVSPRGARKNTLIVTLEWPREELNRRITRRAEEMFQAGLAAEARALFERGLCPDLPAGRSIGYREFFAEGDGGWRFLEDEAGVKALIAERSRRYAKRQICYAARLPDAVTVRLDAGAKAFSRAESALKAELSRFLGR
jgi:tRNA dimethylallyltransferase